MTPTAADALVAIQTLQARLAHVEGELRIAAAREADVLGIIQRERERLIAEVVHRIQNSQGIAPSVRTTLMDLVGAMA